MTASFSSRSGVLGVKMKSLSLRLQAAVAYHNDIGVASPVFAEETSNGQVQDDLIEEDPEINEETFQHAILYNQTLALPARRNFVSPEVQLGEMVFARANCQDCSFSQLSRVAQSPKTRLSG